MAERLRLDVLLVERGLFETRARAQAAILGGLVTVDGRPAAKASERVAQDAELSASPAHPYVGRGALKLLHALAGWPIEVTGRIALDVGASTGGFTQVLLERGAARVYAVDVGRGQLHPILRSDPRVVSLEGIDARNLTQDLIADPPSLVVSDVSFISLAKALPQALALASPGANLVALVKPQFEVGPEGVGRGGIVKDPAARQAALNGVAAFLKGEGWSVRASVESPIEGGSGNREWLLWATR